MINNKFKITPITPSVRLKTQTNFVWKGVSYKIL